MPDVQERHLLCDQFLQIAVDPLPFLGVHLGRAAVDQFVRFGIPGVRKVVEAVATQRDTCVWVATAATIRPVEELHIEVAVARRIQRGRRLGLAQLHLDAHFAQLALDVPASLRRGVSPAKTTHVKWNLSVSTGIGSLTYLRSFSVNAGVSTHIEESARARALEITRSWQQAGASFGITFLGTSEATLTGSIAELWHDCQAVPNGGQADAGRAGRAGGLERARHSGP